MLDSGINIGCVAMEKHLESGIGHGAAPNARLRRIVSGGQTGDDRAALDVALEQGIEIGGWVPKGRVAEDGTIPERYVALQEATSADPAVRTRLNVRDSD